MTYDFYSQTPSTVSKSEFAHAVGLKPQTIRKSLSQKGEVLGIRPIKLPNGRLRWRKEEIVLLIGEGK